jgi:outer membrane cobalamin receptor
MRRRAALAFAVVVATIAARARADEDEPQVLVVQGSAAPAFASTAREGERPRDVADAAALVEDTPGVHVRRAGAEGSFATISIRGSASNQVAATFAGVPITGGADPSLDLATLPLWPGAALRVHRTFAPAALGGGYLGGVVEVEPIELSRGAHTELYDAFGSFGAYRLRAADVRALSEDVRLGSGVSYSRWNGDFPYYDPNLGADRTRKSAGGAQLAGVAQARIDRDAWTILATALAQARQDGVPGDISGGSIVGALARDRELAAVEARRRDDDGRTLVRAFVRREARDFHDANGARASGTVLDGGFALGRSVRSGAFFVDARLDGEIEGASSSSYGQGTTQLRLRSGLAIDATWNATRALVLVAAARGDLRRDDGSGRDATSTTELLPSAHVGGELTIARSVSIAAHAGALARSPSFLELLGDGATYAASPGLRAERSLAVDAGFRFRFGDARLGVEAELTGFASRTTDFIVVVPVGIGTFHAINLGDAYALGSEATVAVVAGPARLLASWTGLLTRDGSDEPSYRGRPLPGRPPHDLTLDAVLTRGRVSLRYGFDFTAATTLDRAGLYEQPARITHDVGLHVRLGGGLVLVGEVRNLFDQRTSWIPAESGTSATVLRPTSDFLLYPVPGRRFTIALRWTAEGPSGAP